MFATLVWVAFWVLGLPDYYQQYSRTAMIWYCALLLPPITLVVVLVLRRLRPGRRMAVALWWAFYFTVPLFVYDWLYCGVFLGNGLGFLSRYWYLTIYYGIPWFVLPLAALGLGSRPRQERDAPPAAGAGP